MISTAPSRQLRRPSDSKHFGEHMASDRQSIVRIRLVQTLDTKNISNLVTYVQDPADAAPYPNAAVDQLASVVSAAYVTLITAVAASALSLTEVIADKITALTIDKPGPPPTYKPQVDYRSVFTAGLPTAGGIPTDYLPTFNAYKAGKATGLVGRTKNGSFHQAGIVEADTIGDNIDPAIIAARLTAFAAFLTPNRVATVGALSYNFLPVVWSLTEMKKAPLPLAVFAFDHAYGYSTVTLNPLVGTMRRRKRRIARG